MPMPDSVPDDAEREAKRRAMRKARESVQRDGIISDADMSPWLESWGTASELPPPAPK